MMIEKAVEIYDNCKKNATEFCPENCPLLNEFEGDNLCNTIGCLKVTLSQIKEGE